MSNPAIAQIRLAPGRAGFYDEYSNIYLTVGQPTAYVYSGTNCVQLRKSIKNGTIQLVSGSLGEDVADVRIIESDGRYWVIPNTEEAHKPVTIEDVQPALEKMEKFVKIEDNKVVSEHIIEEEPAPIVEEVKEETPEVATEETTSEEQPAEEAKEEVVEPAAEEAPAKKTTRKRTTKKTVKKED